MDGGWYLLSIQHDTLLLATQSPKRTGRARSSGSYGRSGGWEQISSQKARSSKEQEPQERKSSSGPQQLEFLDQQGPQPASSTGTEEAGQSHWVETAPQVT